MILSFHFRYISSIFFGKCDVRWTVKTVDQGCQSDHVMSFFSEVSDELKLYHATPKCFDFVIPTWIHASDELQAGNISLNLLTVY